MNLKLFCAVCILGLVGCATQVTEICGTLPDGSEFCTFVEIRK